MKVDLREKYILNLSPAKNLYVYVIEYNMTSWSPKF